MTDSVPKRIAGSVWSAVPRVARLRRGVRPESNGYGTQAPVPESANAAPSAGMKLHA